MEKHLDDLEFASLEVKDSLQKRKMITRELSTDSGNSRDFEEEILLYIKYMRELNANVKNYDLFIPIPYINQRNYHQIEDVVAKIKNQTTWLKEIIHFYEFITNHHLLITEAILPSDFLFTKVGNVALFTGYEKLTYSMDSFANRSFKNLEHFEAFMNDYANYFYQHHYQAEH